MPTIRGFITRLLCTHDYVRVWTIHGDEIIHRNGNRSCWVCRHCYKRVYSKSLNRIEK